MAALNKLGAQLEAKFAFQAERSYAGLPNTVNNSSFGKRIAFVTGAAIALGANELYAQLRTLAPSTAEDLDLAGSGLTNPLGDAGISFARIKGVLIWLLSATDTIPVGDGSATETGNACSSIKVGGAAEYQAKLFMDDVTDKVVIHNGGFILVGDPGATGYAVTAATADKLKIENMDAAVPAKYLLVLLGSAT